MFVVNFPLYYNLQNIKLMIKYFVLINVWSYGQEVKTSPSHGGFRGSIPLRTTSKNHPPKNGRMIF